MSRLASRFLTVEALLLLPLARLLVERVAMKRWRTSLGVIAPNGELREASEWSDHEWRFALKIARHVDRAADRLPLHTKCLPRAIVLQWMLQRRKLVSRLVIAVQRGAERSDDHFHAWVEHDGEMLIGHCDRSLYRPLMSLASVGAPALPRGG